MVDKGLLGMVVLLFHWMNTADEEDAQIEFKMSCNSLTQYKTFQRDNKNPKYTMLTILVTQNIVTPPFYMLQDE